MKRVINAGFPKLLPCIGINTSSSGIPTEVDVREEYANAFRTESYNDFWGRVLALSSSNRDSSTTCDPTESTSAARLPSYRIFAEHLLDPDQPTVLSFLDQTHNPPTVQTLLLNYFTATANASFLCGALLKGIDQMRVNYRSLEGAFKSLKPHQISSQNQLEIALTKLAHFQNFPDPFNFTAGQVTVTKFDCSELLKILEFCREKTKNKLEIRTKLKHCSALFIVILTASLAVVVVTHAVAMLVAAPSCMLSGSLELASTKRLAKRVAQLDAAAKGTFILVKDLETISRLVARLSDELEHMRSMIGYWLERGADGGSQVGAEVVSQLKSAEECGFSQQLDDMEEHLYLCFMTINKSRNLVLKEIVDPNPNPK